jgi:hypothetical protein
MHFPLNRVLAIALLAGCAGDIDSDRDARATGAPTPGMNPGAGSGATLPGAGVGAAAPGTPGTGAASPTGASSGASTTLNLAGAPQYSRFVRLTNAHTPSTRRIIRVRGLWRRFGRSCGFVAERLGLGRAGLRLARRSGRSCGFAGRTVRVARLIRAAEVALAKRGRLIQ